MKAAPIQKGGRRGNPNESGSNPKKEDEEEVQTKAAPIQKRRTKRKSK